MHDREHGNGPSQTGRWRKRAWLIAGTVLFLAGAAGLLWIVRVGWDRRSADERVAEIEAARAIPAAENAATIYNELLRDPQAISAVDKLPDSNSVRERVFGLGRHSPWRSEEHPELVVWIAEHQFIMDRLAQTLAFDKCCFPISIDVVNWRDVGERARVMRHWGDLLTIAAGNDLAEGRTDAAIAKWHCLLQMVHHLDQQPESLGRVTARTNGQSALRSMARFLVEADPEETDLRKLEAMPIPAEDGSARYCEEMRLIYDLEIRRQLEACGPWDRLRYFVWNHNPFRERERSRVDRHRDLYLRYLSVCRGTRILIALKRCESTTGQWPRSLDEIRSSLPAEVLIDPSNQGPFVYTPTADGFRLYSRGKNHVDENGKWESDAWDGKGCDDWLIWSPTVAKPEPPKEESMEEKLAEIFGKDYVQSQLNDDANDKQ